MIRDLDVSIVVDGRATPARGTRCRSCDARIFWAVSPNARAIPVDLEPVPGGQYVVAEICGTAPNLRKADDGAAPGSRYDSHFKTCPNASAHSQKARR